MPSDEGSSHAIVWLPHGRAWKVMDKKRLAEQVVPK